MWMINDAYHSITIDSLRFSNRRTRRTNFDTLPPTNIRSTSTRILFSSERHGPCESSKDSSPRSSAWPFRKFFRAPSRESGVALRDLRRVRRSKFLLGLFLKKPTIFASAKEEVELLAFLLRITVWQGSMRIIVSRRNKSYCKTPIETEISLLIKCR